ncbi:uncharacterized protein [Euwallacea fornicatus]|uniref:uncharacterized protein n=1 Tax=Euwallacea fornicatus TaxID=995702 RepID=UPI00338FCBA5
MKAVLVLSLILICGLIHQQVRGDDINDDMTVLEKISKIIRILIKEYIGLFKDFILIKKANLNLTSQISVGYLKHSDLILFGLDNLIVDPNKKDIFELQYDEDNKVLTISSNILIPEEVGLNLHEYDMDCGISNTIPLFGEGNFSFNLNSVKASFYMNISFSDGFKVDYLEIEPHLNVVKFIVTGFWKVPDLNNFVSTLVTTFANLFVLFWELEIDLITCVISGLLECVLNQEKHIIIYLIQRCRKIAAHSSYPIVDTLFNNDQLDFLEYASEANILKYAQIASEYLEKEMETYHMLL